MTPSFGRNQGLGTDDFEYVGSSFLDVRQPLFENCYYDVWGGKYEPPLPISKVTFLSVFWGFLPFLGNDVFKQAAIRTVDSYADLRPGKDGMGFQRLVHPNGICLTGTWSIDADSPYSGHFKKESRGRIIARISVGSSDTHRDGAKKSFSMVGKVFPTIDENGKVIDKTEKVIPANFITQSNLGAADVESVLDVKMRNTPDIQAFARGIEVTILLRTGMALMAGDRIPDERQVYSIAELGRGSEELNAPRFMQIRASEENFRSIDHRDFRDEIMSYLYDPGVRYNYAQHKKTDTAGRVIDRDFRDNAGREFVFDIDVSDDGNQTGTMANRVWKIRDWKTIGQIRFNDAVISRNADRVIHFHHDAWRDDRNDPSTAMVPKRRDAPPAPPVVQ
jgi:hypothetical protein